MNHPELGVQALIDDYDLIEDSELLNHPEYNWEKVKALKLIQGALRLSAHILAEDKAQLAGQLLGRLLCFNAKSLEFGNKSRSVYPPLNGHSSSVLAVAIAPDGKRVISGSRDNTLKVWDLETREIITSFTGESPITCCAVAPDGVTIVAGEASGRVHFLRLEC